LAADAPGRTWRSSAAASAGSGVALDRAEDVQGQPPAGDQHPPDFPQRGRPIRNELQPQLAEHHVERRSREGQRERAAAVPRDRGARHGRQGPGDRQHAGIDVQRGNPPGVPHTCRRYASRRSRTAGHIQHPMARQQRRPASQVGSPHGRHRRNQETLVQLWRAGVELPLLLSAHQILTPGETIAAAARRLRSHCRGLSIAGELTETLPPPTPPSAGIRRWSACWIITSTPPQSLKPC
jgi:hypothetical protein